MAMEDMLEDRGLDIALAERRAPKARLEADGWAENVRGVTHGNAWSVYAQDPAQAGNAPAALIDRILLREASQVKVERRVDGFFKVQGQPDGTDIAATGEIASLTPRALEGSNVNAISVMVKMMEQSRSFEHQVRIIKESKSGDESGATMLKLS